MTRSQRKPSERSNKKDSVKVNVKGSGKVKKQSKVVTKVSKTKAKIKCSKCSKLISSNNSKVKMCASCLKNIATLSKKNPVPASKPQSLQNSKRKVASRKTGARGSLSSSKNNLATSRLSNLKPVKSPSKTYKSPQTTTNRRKSNVNEKIAKNNKTHTSVDDIKSANKIGPKSDLSLQGKMGLRGKKRSYVQLASGVSDDENQTKKKKTAKDVISKVRETRNKKPTPKASEWLNTINPKKKITPKEKTKVETKSKSPKRKSTSKTTSNSRKSNSPLKTNAGQKKNVPSSVSKKSVKRLINIKADVKKPSPQAKNKVNTIPSTAKSTTSTRSSARQSAKYTSDSKVIVQKKTARISCLNPGSRVAKKDNDSVKSNNTDLTTSTSSARQSAKYTSDSKVIVQKKTARISCLNPGSRVAKKDNDSVKSNNTDLTTSTSSARQSAKYTSDSKVIVQKKTARISCHDPGSRVAKKDNDSVKSNNTDLKDSVFFAKEILEDILISVAKGPEISLLTDTDNSKEDLNAHIDSIVTLEYNAFECVDDLNGKELQLSDPTSEEGHDACTTEDIELHLSPEKDIELHISPEAEETEMDISDNQSKDKVHEEIKENKVDSLKCILNGDKEIESSKVDKKCYESREKDELLETVSKTCLFEDGGHKTIQGLMPIYAGDKPHDSKLEKKENGLSRSLPHSSANISEITNVSPLESKNEILTVVSSPSDRLSQNNTHFNTDFSHLPILDSSKHIAPEDNDNQSSSLVSASEAKNNNCCELPKQKSLDKNSESKDMCNQTLNKKDPEEILSSTEKKNLVHKCLPEQNKSFGSLVKPCAGNNLSSNGHEENGYCKAESTEDADRFSQSQSLSKVSHNIHSTNYSSTLKSSSIIILKEKSKFLHIQDTFAVEGDIHCPATTNEEQINAELQLDDTLKRPFGQGVLTNKKESTHFENKNDESMQQDTIHYREIESISHDISSIVNNDQVIENKVQCIENASLVQKNSDKNVSCQLMEKNSHDCKADDEVLLLITDSNNPNTGNYKESCSTDFDDRKVVIEKVSPRRNSRVNENQSNEESLLKYDKCKTETSEILSGSAPIIDGEDFKSENNVQLPTKDSEAYMNENNDELPTKYSDTSKTDRVKLLASKSMEDHKNQTVDTLLTNDSEKSVDCKNESCALLSTKHDVCKGSAELLPANEFEGGKYVTGEVLSSNDSNCCKTNSDELLPTQEFEHRIDETDQKLPPTDCNVLKSDTDERLLSSESDGLMTEVNGNQMIDVAPLTLDSDHNSNSFSEPVKNICEDNDVDKLTNVMRNSIDEQVDKTEQEPSCQNERSPQIEECKTSQSDQSGICSNQIATEPGEDNTEEETLCQKERSPETEEHKTTQIDQKEIFPSLIEIKTDEENANNLPPDNEIPVSRTESPMNVDNKTDFENNENSDELTLKIEEIREDCISIDGTDVESMQCNSETRSSNRMSVDEEVITMDIDQDETAVDGSECQNFGMKVGNELNMEVN